MATATLERTLVNPGRRRRRSGNPSKRRMSLKQKLHFGSLAQRAAAKRALSGHRKRRRTANPSRKSTTTRRRRRVSARAPVKRRRVSHRRRTSNPRRRRRSTATTKRRVYRHRARSRRRVRNIGEIVSFGLGANPGRKRSKTMARRKRRATSHRRRTHRRRRTYNPGLRAMLGLSRSRRRSSGRRRRANTGRRTYSRRRSNPGMLSGTVNDVFGLIGGAYLTSMLTTTVVPAAYQSGIMGYVATAVMAYASGYAVSRFARKPGLGKALTHGGLVYLALKILNDFVPSIAGMSPIGLRGALARSSFYTPQIPMGNSFTSFVTPSAVMSAMPVSLKGRTGRIN